MILCGKNNSIAENRITVLEKELGRKPNIIIILTDQQREVRDFPAPWVEENLKSLKRLQKNGITYSRSYTNTSPCWANRGVAMSGLYPLVSQTCAFDSSLSPSLSNFPKVMKEAGYKTYYKGKWHLNAVSDAFAHTWPTESNNKETAIKEDGDMLKLYGLEGWTSPDAGTSLVKLGSKEAIGTNLGGGIGTNDERVITGKGLLAPGNQESVIDFLKAHANDEEPYCLFISLVNPHDISVFPDAASAKEFGYPLKNVENYEGFKCPESYEKDDLSTKPSCQAYFLNSFDGGKMNAETALDYLKLYAYMTAEADKLIGLALDAMTDEQVRNSVILRTADHGEMGAAHGGLREKMEQIYEESVNIPLIISNPILFPEPVVCDELVSQIDLIPTIAEIIGLDPVKTGNKFLLQGKSVAQTISDPKLETYEGVLFNYYSTGKQTEAPANLICAVFTKQFKYGVYFAPLNGWPTAQTYPDMTDGDINRVYQVDKREDVKAYKNDEWYPVVDLSSVQFEMYDLKNDKYELTNLLYGDISKETSETQVELHALLTHLLMKNNSLPIGWLDIQF